MEKSRSRKSNCSSGKVAFELCLVALFRRMRRGRQGLGVLIPSSESSVGVVISHKPSCYACVKAIAVLIVVVVIVVL